MSLPPFSGPDSPDDPIQKGMQSAYNRYLDGVQIIMRSLDIPVGQTPKELIWQLNKAKLYYYLPTRPQAERHGTPLLLVYALINKPFIFDLVPGRSFIEYLVEQGFEVYLLDWGSPGFEDKHTLFDDYITEYLTRAVRRVRRHAGASEITMLGYCIGATIAVTYASLYPEAPLRNLILLTAPLDFSEKSAGSMALWLDRGNLDVDKLVNTYGNIPGELIKLWAKMLKPMENFVGSYLTMWKLLGDEAAVYGWQAINRWVEDVIPFAGEAFRQLVKDYMWGNKLIQGEHRINGNPVDPANIRAAFLNVVAEFDHIVSQSQSISIMDVISSEDKELRIIPSTHVGLMASHRARHKLWPELVEWLASRSD